MKNAELSWAVRGLASLVISGFCLPTISWAQAKVDTGDNGVRHRCTPERNGCTDRCGCSTLASTPPVQSLKECWQRIANASYPPNCLVLLLLGWT